VPEEHKLVQGLEMWPETSRSLSLFAERFWFALETSVSKISVKENFDKREKKAQITFPLRHFFPLKVVPLIEVFLYSTNGGPVQIHSLMAVKHGTWLC
jgi:hypothetical protein